MKQSQISLRVASYNIRKAVGLDWKRDAQRIIKVLGELDADIIALQEADKRLGDRPGTLPANILESELGYKFARIEGCGPSHGWHGNAILYRDPFLLIESEKINIPTLEPRGAVGALFNNGSGLKFKFIGVHLSLIGNIRAKQIKYLSDKIENEDELVPTIIAGDFNEWREMGKACRAAGAGFHIITPGASFHSKKPIVPLDRFILWGDVNLQNMGVHKSPLSKRASDHLPIYMNITIR